jgi:hypothetical protein
MAPSQAPPTPSTSTQQAPQGNTSAPVIGDTTGTQRHRVRKADFLQLNACICGVTVMELEIQEGKGVMKCCTPGCETVWVSEVDLFACLAQMLTLKYLLNLL